MILFPPQSLHFYQAAETSLGITKLWNIVHFFIIITTDITIALRMTF